jgi:hypothetical protein
MGLKKSKYKYLPSDELEASIYELINDTPSERLRKIRLENVKPIIKCSRKRKPDSIVLYPNVLTTNKLNTKDILISCVWYNKVCKVMEYFTGYESIRTTFIKDGRNYYVWSCCLDSTENHTCRFHLF